MSVSLRPALYEAVIGLLDPNEDLAVRLEAAQTLKTDILFACLNLFILISLIKIIILSKLSMNCFP